MPEAVDPGEAVKALTTPLGVQLLKRVAGEDFEAQGALRIGERLRREYAAGLVAAAIAQHELRLAARTKFARAPDMLFTRPGLEQASAEITSRHRARRYAESTRVIDLCTGIGGDLISLGESCEVTAVDRDDVHLHMARHNAAVYGLAERVQTVCSDVRDVDVSGFDGVFIDPARRVAGRRLRPGASEPPLEWCLSLVDRANRVGIKAAPGLDPNVVPDGWEIEFIAEGRNLKEAALWSPALATATRRATIMPSGHTLLPQSGPELDLRPPGAFLLDPNPAVTRAGLVEELGREAGAWKIDEKIAFLCTGAEVRTPFARTLRIVESLPWHEKAIAARMHELGIGAVDIRRRGLAGNVDHIQRRLNLRGSRKATLVMTRVRDRPWALVCLDVADPLANKDLRPYGQGCDG